MLLIKILKKMNSNPPNISFSHNNILYSNPKTKNINYPEIGPSLQYKNGNQETHKNIQYFPIVTKGSFTGSHTIYLAAEDNQITNDYIPKYEKKYPLKNNNNDQDIILIPQRSIGLQIQKSKFEYLLNIPVKNENEKPQNKNIYLSKNSIDKNSNKIYPIKEEEKWKKYQNI